MSDELKKVLDQKVEQVYRGTPSPTSGDKVFDEVMAQLFRKEPGPANKDEFVPLR